MKFDSAAWHYTGHFPKELPPEAGATHIGMFMAWVIKNDLLSEQHAEKYQADIDAVLKREITGRDYLLRNCNSQITDEDLSDTGRAFAFDFYCDDEGYREYIELYDKTFCKKLSSFYEVRDTWENYDKISEAIDQKFGKWASKRSKKN